MKRILFIESSDIGAFYTAEGARRLGYRPLFVCDFSGIQGDTRLKLLREKEQGNLIEADTKSEDSILSALKTAGISAEEIAGVMTFLDSRLQLAFQLGQTLNAPAQLDPAIVNLKSKSRVQELIPEWSPKNVVLSNHQIPYNEILKLIEQHQQVILKPTKMAGAISAKIFDESNYLEIGKYISEQTIPAYLDDNEWVCQAFIKGDLISVEGFVNQGTITILGCSDRQKIGFTESRLEFPVEERFPLQRQQDIRKALTALFTRSKFRQGFFHVEFMVTVDSVFIIDANVGRLGGGPLGEMIPISFGLDVSDFYSFVIEQSLIGLENLRRKDFSWPKWEETTLRESMIGICYGSPCHGYFEQHKVETSDKFRHTLILDHHQYIEPMGSNNWSWIGIISSPKDTFATKIESLQINIDGKWVLPCY